MPIAPAALWPHQRDGWRPPRPHDGTVPKGNLLDIPEPPPSDPGRRRRSGVEPRPIWIRARAIAILVHCLVFPQKEAEMRVIVATFLGVTAFGASSLEAAPNSTKENWVEFAPTMSFELGPGSCGYGSHQSVWRDWRGDWHWGPCVPNG